MPSDVNLNVKHIVISENELNELPSSHIQCWLCGIGVKNRSNLRAHQIKTHRIFRDEADHAFYSKRKCTLTTMYHCPISTCKHAIGSTGGFSSFYRLKQHYQVVHMEKSYQCEQCGSRYPTPSALSYHRRLCGNFHFCPVCSRAYSYKKHLYQHFRRSGHVLPPSKASKPRHSIPSGTSLIQPKPTEELIALTSGEPSAQMSSSSVGLGAGLTTYLSTSVGTLPSSSPSVNDISTLILAPNTTVLVNLIVLSDTLTCRAQSSQVVPQILTSDAASTVTSQNTVSCIPSEASVVSRCCGTSPTITHDFSMQTGQFMWPSPSSVVKESGVQSELMDVFDLISTSTDDFLPSTPGALMDNAAAAAPTGSTVSVSVNTGTDDDDITSFIGSLFCDASVETNFSIPQLVNDFTDTGLDLLGDLCSPSAECPSYLPDSSSPTRDEVEDEEACGQQQFCSHLQPRFVSTMSQAAAPTRDREQQHQSDDYLFQALADEGVQTAQFFRYASLATPTHEHASMQTEQVACTHVAASTDELVPSSLYYYLRNSLDTPSPLSQHRPLSVTDDCTSPQFTNYACDTPSVRPMDSPSHQI